MAKFAVLILAALAFQAASAGVHRHHRYQEKTLGDYKYGQLEGYKTGEFDKLYDQFETVTKDLTVYFQKALPNDRLVIKTITYQSRELAQYIDTVIDKLQVEANNYSEKVNAVLEQVISELRKIQIGFEHVANTTDVSNVSQLKNQFYNYFQTIIVQIEKLVRLVQADSEQTKGSFHLIVKNVVADFLYAFQNIYSQVQYFGVRGEQTTPRQLAIQIEEITKALTGYLQGLDYSQIQQFRYALREYVQHVEVILNRLQEVESTIGHVEIDTVFQQVYNKLRRVLVPLKQFIEAENIENFNVVRSQLIKESQFVAEAFEQLVQYAQTGSQQTFIYEVLGDYLYALQQFRYHIQSGYQGGFYGFYKGGFYGKKGYQGTFGKTEYQGVFDKSGYQGSFRKSGYQGLFGKTGYQGQFAKSGYQGQFDKSGYQGLFGKTGYQGLFDKSGYQGQFDKSGYQGLFGKTGYQGLFDKSGYQGLSDKSGFQGQFDKSGYQGLFGKTGYKGLNKYDELYGKTGYQGGLYGKYQGFNKYGLKELEIQMQTVVRDLYQSLQTVSVDDVAVRQTFIHLIREYAQELEFIVERLHQAVISNADADVYVFQQYIQNLRQIVVALQQVYTTESFSATELRSHFYLYVQKFVSEFEKLISGIQQTKGTFYNYVQNVLVQYLTVTYELHMKFQHITEIAQEYQVYGRQYAGDKYSAGKYYGKYNGAKYGQYYGLQGRQFVETPRELVNQIQYVASDLSATLQNSMVYNQQYAQVLSVRVREFAQIIKNIVDQLECYEHVDTVIQQVIYKLREVQLHLQQLSAYNVFTNVHQLKAEFDNYIQIAVAHIEKLALIAQEETQGDYYYVVKSVLNLFLNGLHDIHYQIQEVAQYGEFAQYGQQSGQGYGFGKYAQQYGKGYGFGKYGQQYGQGYGFGKYGQQYGQGYGYGKYGQQYGQGYGLQGLEQYGKGFGYGKQYDSEFGLQGRQYGYGLQGLKYGYGFQGKTVEQLANQIQIVANQVADELQTVAVSDKQVRQVFLVQARQLVQIIDNIIDRFQVDLTYGNDNMYQQVLINLRQIRGQLQQIVNSGVITTVYQIKAQIANYIQEVASELQKLALVAHSDLQQVQIVKNVLVQYIVYLHNVQYQLQYNVLGYQNINEYQSQYVPSGKYFQTYQDAIRAY